MSKWRLNAPKRGMDALLQLASVDTRDTPHQLGTACPQLAWMPLNHGSSSNGLKATGSNPKPVLHLESWKARPGDVDTWELPTEHTWIPSAHSHFPTLVSAAILPSTALTPPNRPSDKPQSLPLSHRFGRLRKKHHPLRPMAGPLQAPTQPGKSEGNRVCTR